MFSCKVVMVSSSNSAGVKERGIKVGGAYLQRHQAPSISIPRTGISAMLNIQYSLNLLKIPVLGW